MTDIADLADLGAELDWPSFEAETQAHDALIRRADMGRLSGLLEWLAAVQGVYPVRPIARPRLVVVTSDHAVATTGASSLTSADTARAVAALGAGSDGPAPLAELAHRSGVGVRPEAIAADSSASEAILRGTALADSEIDGGTDFFIVGNIGAGSTTAAAAVISVLADIEPVKAIGRGGSGIDDIGWMHKISAVRDARLAAKPHRNDPVAFLDELGAADLGLLAGLMLRASVRRTPVLFDGVVAAAAGLIADDKKPGARRWWQPAQATGDPGFAAVVAKFNATAIVDLGLAAGDGRGGLLALEVLRSAALLAQPTGPAQASIPGKSSADV
jgi:nicotinate-nucleotide--dimethylbenzimidazole phosphoribosyltransferase